MSLLLHNPGFRWLWSGQLLSTLGIWSLRTVLIIWVYSIAHTGTAVSLVGLAEVIPLLVLAPLGGVLIDRWPRRLIMAGGMGATAIVMLPLLLASGITALPVIIGIALLINAVVQLSFNASQAALPVVAGGENLAQANSLSSVLTGGVAVVGPGLAALLDSTLGPHGAIAIMAAIFALAVPVYLRVPAPRAVREEAAGSVGREMMDGVRYVLRSRLLVSLVGLVAVVGLSIGGLSVLDVVFVTRGLHLPASTVGLLLSAAGFAELGGGLIMASIAARLTRVYHRVLGGSIILAGVGFAVYSTSHSLGAAVPALAVSSLSFPFIIVAFTTLQQRVTTDAFMGRVSSAITTTMALSMLISLAAVGALADLLGVRVVILGEGVILLLAGVMSLAVIRQTPPAPMEGPVEREQPVPSGAVR